MKVLISGYYGFGNVGDESVLQAIIRGLREIDPDISITVLSAAPGVTAELNQVSSIHRYNPFKILLDMIRANVFISGGGTLFQNTTSTRSFFYYIGLLLLARLMFKKTAVLAQGFGPLTGRFNRFLAKTVLNRVNLITLRDKESYDRLRQLGVKNKNVFITADPTAALKQPLAEEGRRVLSLEAVRLDRPLLGIAVRSVPKKDEENLYKTLAVTIDWLAREHRFAPVFLLFECPGDMAETSRVLNFMEEKANVIFRICRPDEMLAVIADLDLLIGLRLHSLIFAAMNAVPLLGISYDPKVKAFLNEIGQPYFDAADRLDPAALRTALAEIIKGQESVRARLKAAKQQLHEQAEQNFKLFFEHFSK